MKKNIVILALVLGITATSLCKQWSKPSAYNIENPYKLKVEYAGYEIEVYPLRNSSQSFTNSTHPFKYRMVKGEFENPLRIANATDVKPSECVSKTKDDGTCLAFTYEGFFPSWKYRPLEKNGCIVLTNIDEDDYRLDCHGQEEVAKLNKVCNPQKPSNCISNTHDLQTSLGDVTCCLVQPK